MRKFVFSVIALAVMIAAVQPAFAQQDAKSEDQLKAKLGMAVRMLAAEGLIASSGHMSVRIPGTNKIFINSNYASREFLQTHNVVTVNFEDDKKVGGEEPPPDETFIHT